ncbi:hypothetical protein PG987_009726 [Apiospora arundinis]
MDLDTMMESEQNHAAIQRLRQELAEKEKTLAVVRMQLDCIHHRQADLREAAESWGNHLRRLTMFLNFKDLIIAQQQSQRQ